MKEGLSVRDLKCGLDARGFRTELWEPEEGLWASEALYLYPGEIVCWVEPAEQERIYCLRGMIKLVVSEKEGEKNPQEVYLGEFKPREATISGSLIYGFKAVGHESALVIRMWKASKGRSVTQEEAAVPYDWEIVMR